MSRSNYQTVLITGGAGGLGKQMARQWANLGATIVLWDRDEAGLAAARDFILHSGASAVHTYTCDLTDRDAVRSVGEQVLEEVGPIGAEAVGGPALEARGVAGRGAAGRLRRAWLALKGR